MTFLLDTNVVSEWVAPRPDVNVIRWLDEVDEDLVHLSVMTLGELREGVDRLAPGKRRQQLDRWLSSAVPDRFGRRLLPVDAAVAARWGSLRAAAGSAGRTLPVVNAILSATALVHDLTVVTRNVRDLGGLGVPIVDPWSGTRP